MALSYEVVTERTASPARKAGRHRSLYSGRWSDRVLGVATVVAVLGLWQLFASTGVVDRSITSDPWDVIRAADTFYTGPRALGDLWTSAEEIFWGLLLALVGGILGGAISGTIRRAATIANPLVTIVYAIPTLALAPLFVVWFGIGLRSKIAVIFVLCFFPLYVSTEAGVRAADVRLINVAKAFKASRLFIVRKIVLPAAVPSILAGVRLAIAGSLIGMVVGELIASTKGIGFVILEASSNLDTSLLFVGVFSLSVAALLMRGLVVLAERRLERWRPRAEWNHDGRN